MCVGAWGLMSRKAIACSSRCTSRAGIFPATILQKTQSSRLCGMASTYMARRHSSGQAPDTRNTRRALRRHDYPGRVSARRLPATSGIATDGEYGPDDLRVLREDSGVTVVLDASVLIAHFDPHDAHHDAAPRLLIEMAGQALMAHPLTIAEVLVGPARVNRAVERRQSLREMRVDVIDIEA